MIKRGKEENSVKNPGLFKDQKGSLMVESAILLPVFLVGVLILAYLIKGFYIQESIHAILTDQAVKLSVETASAPSLQTQLFFGLRVNQRIKEEDPFGEFSVDAYALPKGEEYQIRAFYHVPMNFPVSLGGGLSVAETIVVRSFSGKIPDGSPFSFSLMEQEGSGKVAYIFPHEGEKFHEKDCRYVSVYPVEKILTSHVKDQYSPCKLCDAKSLKNGSVVYCFEKSGSAYHRYDCASVNRYVIQMTVQDAEASGYRRCSVCG